MQTKFRHDLGQRAVVGAVRREADDVGEIAAVYFRDDEADVTIGIRIRTPEQALALRKAADEALAALELGHLEGR